MPFECTTGIKESIGRDLVLFDSGRLVLAKARVYISGPISGIPFNNVPAFVDAERHIRAAGCEPVNPLELAENKGEVEYAQLIENDLLALKTCSFILLLRNWQKSPGARAVKALAEAIGIERVEVRYKPCLEIIDWPDCY